MRQKSGPEKAPAEQVVKDIRRATRRQFSAEEKIRIVLEGVRGEESIAELCRREGIASSMYYGWSKEFLDAGKRRLAGDRFIDDLAACLARLVQHIGQEGIALCCTVGRTYPGFAWPSMAILVNAQTQGAVAGDADEQRIEWKGALDPLLGAHAIV